MALPKSVFDGMQSARVGAVYGLLPTHLSTSSLTAGSVVASLTGFVLFYTGLLIAEMFLMVKFARMGPGSLGTGRYANEPAHAIAH